MLAEDVVLSSSRLKLAVTDLGLMAYERAYEIQKDLVARMAANRQEPNHLLFVEHPATYTFGRKASQDSVALCEGIAVERGGEATFHNPGQLVAYPLIRLEGVDRDVHRFLRQLEESLIETLADFEISAERKAGATGVWVQNKEKKIASIGVAVSQWITYHGLALNVSNDLSGFSKIHPCGFSASVMTSMQEMLGEKCPHISQVKQSLRRALAKRFGP